ncbi:MAG: TlpA disulfide reductase family protein, partial [Phycisphaerales bacterium JB038]
MSHRHKLLLLALVLLTPLTARADSLRNLKPGQEVPAYALRTIDDQIVESEKLKGQVVVVVYLSAEQKSSESAALSAHTMVQEMRNKEVELLLVTADAAKTDYFRAWRDRAGVHEPLALDLKRDLYGQLGLIVLPTTLVIDAEGRLAHVISSYKTNYEHV